VVEVDLTAVVATTIERSTALPPAPPPG